MNYLELQQRANLLVDKVNQYEASLTETTFNETEILNQHLYADIFSLRPVLKMLFGKTIDDKLSRTLLNDVDLRVFASSSPMWNSSFNLLSSYNPYPLTKKLKDTLTSVGDTSSEIDSEGWWRPTGNTKYFKGNVDDYIPDANSELEYRKLTLYYKYIGNYNTKLGPSFSIVDNTNRNNLAISFTTSGILIQTVWIYKFIPLPAKNNIIKLELEIIPCIDNKISVELKPAYRCFQNVKATNITTGEELATQSLYTFYIASNGNTNYLPPKEIEFGLRFQNNRNSDWALNLEQSTLEIMKLGFSVDYQSNNRHEFMNDINMYNENNMIVQDAQINSILNRNSRIASGLNYSYSSNIQDALVTESQVANIFKWNTTTDKEIYNNTLTINRQVPGLVCYYLGNGYNGTYTATIPYVTRYDNINSVNYSTPVYYGAFYRNDDVEQSQVGLNMGAECCRIFMPGMNYTRGKLQSPQQIWQPDKRVGQDNIGYGFNWQGQAIYHELVFKNRRQGCQAQGLDFIPSISSDEDNDPQGLALRTALAQQKQFYYNRPFFDELTELNGVNITKLVEEIGNASRTEYTPHYTVVGNPTISDDFILSNTGNGNYIDTGYTASGFNSIEISFDVLFTDFNSTYYFTGQVDNHNYTCPQLASDTNGSLNLACSYTGSSWIYLYNTDVKLELNTRYNIKAGWKNETKKWYGSITNISTGVETDLGEVDCQQAPLFSYPLEICRDQNKPTYIQTGLTMYLDTFKITKDNIIDYQVVTSQVVPLDDEAFFRDYKLDYDTWATALDKPL